MSSPRGDTGDQGTPEEAPTVTSTSQKGEKSTGAKLPERGPVEIQEETGGFQDTAEVEIVHEKDKDGNLLSYIFFKTHTTEKKNEKGAIKKNQDGVQEDDSEPASEKEKSSFDDKDLDESEILSEIFDNETVDGGDVGDTMPLGSSAFSNIDNDFANANAPPESELYDCACSSSYQDDEQPRKNPPNYLLMLLREQKRAREEAEAASAEAAAAASTVAAEEASQRRSGRPVVVPRRTVTRAEREAGGSHDEVLVLPREFGEALAGNQGRQQGGSGALSQLHEPTSLWPYALYWYGCRNAVFGNSCGKEALVGPSEEQPPVIRHDTFEFVTNIIQFLGRIRDINTALGMTANMKIEWTRILRAKDARPKDLIISISFHLVRGEFEEADVAMNMLRNTYNEHYFYLLFINLIRLYRSNV